MKILCSKQTFSRRCILNNSSLCDFNLNLQINWKIEILFFSNFCECLTDVCIVILHHCYFIDLISKQTSVFFCFWFTTWPILSLLREWFIWYFSLRSYWIVVVTRVIVLILFFQLIAVWLFDRIKIALHVS